MPSILGDTKLEKITFPPGFLFSFFGYLALHGPWACIDKTAHSHYFPREHLLGVIGGYGMGNIMYSFRCFP